MLRRAIYLYVIVTCDRITDIGDWDTRKLYIQITSNVTLIQFMALESELKDR